MHTYSKPIQIRWSDLTLIFHVLHSGITTTGPVAAWLMVENGHHPRIDGHHHIGPILLRKNVYSEGDTVWGRYTYQFAGNGF